MIKYFRNDTFGKKNITTTEIVFIQLLSCNVVSKQKKWKWKHRIPWHVHTFKSHLNSEIGSPIFLLFGSWSLVRSSHPEVLCRKGALRNFAKFTGKHLSQSLFFNKVAGLRPKVCIFIKKRLWHGYFHASFVEFLRTPSLIEQCCCLVSYLLVWVMSKFFR